MLAAWPDSTKEKGKRVRPPSRTTLEELLKRSRLQDAEFPQDMDHINDPTDGPIERQAAGLKSGEKIVINTSEPEIEAKQIINTGVTENGQSKINPDPVIDKVDESKINPDPAIDKVDESKINPDPVIEVSKAEQSKINLDPELDITTIEESKISPDLEPKLTEEQVLTDKTIKFDERSIDVVVSAENINQVNVARDVVKLTGLVDLNYDGSAGIKYRNLRPLEEYEDLVFCTILPPLTSEAVVNLVRSFVGVFTHI